MRITTVGPYFRQCSGKRTYTAKADAKRAAKMAMATFRGGVMDAYRCDVCGKFHVGHRPKTGRPQRVSA